MTSGRPSLALDAQFVIAGTGGERTVEADDFFVDLFDTAIEEGEILKEVRIPKRAGWGAHYEKFVRVAHQWPIVAVAAAVKVEGGTISEARVGLTNMGSTPLRARSVEAALVGQPATDEAVRAAAPVGGRGHQPALGPQRRRRLPPAPRHGPDPAGRARGCGSVIAAWT